MNNPYQFAEFFRNSFDFNQLFATQRRNIEALSAANQAIVEGAQAVARCQAEAVREGVETCLKSSRDIFTSGSAPEANVAKQAELARQVFENTLGNLREVSDLLTKASFEAFDVLNQRASQSLAELSQASNSPKKKAA